MSTQGETLHHPINGTTEQTWDGFSWPAFFFGIIWLLMKGLYGHFLIRLVVLVATAGFATPIVWIIYGFVGNGAHRSSFLKKGYLTNEQWEPKTRPAPVPHAAPMPASSPPAPEPLLVADELEKLFALRERGVLSDEEFQVQKSRLLEGGRRSTPERGALPLIVKVDTSSPKACVATLHALGYGVGQPAHDRWEIRHPTSGLVFYAYSPMQLQTRTADFASERASGRESKRDA